MDKPDIEYTVERDDKLPIRFKGELLASVSSSSDRAMGNMYSGSTGRWQKLRLFKTKGGKYICEHQELTKWQGDRDRIRAEVCESMEQVTEFFGHWWLAKELYEEAGIDVSLYVD